MVAAVLERAGAPARAQPGGLEHGLGRGHRAARRGPRARPDRPLRGGRGLAAARGGDAAPARAAARQPVPRPARPLRRARAAGRPLGELVAARRRAAAVRPERRRPAGGGPRPRAARASIVLRARRRLAGAARARSTRPTPSTAATAARAYHYDAVYLGHLGHYRCPSCGRERPTPARRRPTRVAAARACPGSRVDADDAGGRARARASRCPASTTSTTRSRAAALALELGVPLDDGPRRRSRASRGAFGRVGDDRRRRPPSCRSCWSRTPPAPTRCCAR